MLNQAQTKALILEKLGAGMSLSAAIRESGVARPTVYIWLKKDSGFAEAVKGARGGVTGGNPAVKFVPTNPTGKGGFKDRPQDAGGVPSLDIRANQAVGMQHKQAFQTALNGDDLMNQTVREQWEYIKSKHPSERSRDELAFMAKIHANFQNTLPREVATEATVNKTNVNVYTHMSEEELVRKAKLGALMTERMIQEKEAAGKIVEAEARDV